MKSKTSYFNRTLFLNLLKRYWPIFAGYFIIWLIILPIALANMLQYSSISMAGTDSRIYVANAGEQILSLGLYGGVIMSMIFSIFIAMAAFGYLYSSRSVSMICSLPIKREGVFHSVFSAGLVGMLVINIIVFLITLGVEAAYGIIAPGANYMLQWLAMVCMMNLFFFGFASLCASFTGHILALPIVYVVLNFTAYVVEYLIDAIARTIIYGAGMSYPYKFQWLSPSVKLFETNVEIVPELTPNGSFIAVGHIYNGWTTLGIYAAVGIVFAVLSMLIIKHRRMETAGDVVAARPLKPIFKYCLSFGCALVLGIGIYSAAFSGTINSLYGIKSMLFMLLFMLFGAFVGYFAAEMLMQKSLHVFSGHNWTGFGITAVLISAILLCGEYDVFGYERKLPDPNEVKGVEILCAGESVLLEQPENIDAAIKLHGDIISHKDENEQYTGRFDESCYYVSIIYTLKNEETFQRAYLIYSSASSDIYTLTDLMNVKEAIEYRKALEVPVTVDTIADAYINYFDKSELSYKDIELSPTQAYELYTECIIPDINEGSMGKVWFETDDKYYSNVLDCNINLSVEQRLKDNKYKGDYFRTYLTLDAKRSCAWIKENLGIDLYTMGESSDIYEKYNDDNSGRTVIAYETSAVEG